MAHQLDRPRHVLGCTHPLSEALAELNRESGFQRVVLRGLSEQEVASYIHQTAHIEAQPELVRRIHEETEGNAFFYRATVPRKTTLRRMVRRLVDTAFEGSAEGLVLALLEGRDLSAEEAARIRTMLGQARPSAKAKKGHKS